MGHSAEDAQGAPTWEMVAAAEKRASEAEARAEAAEARVALLKTRLAEALARIAVLEEENKKLRARLEQNSSNSSRPPSSDPPGAKAENRKKKKKKKKKTRKRSGRKAGGQPGHRGRTRPLRPVQEADEVRHHHPDECEHCGHSLGEKDEAGPPVPHQQYELPPLVLLLIHNWLHRRSCPRTPTWFSWVSVGENGRAGRSRVPVS